MKSFTQRTTTWFAALVTATIVAVLGAGGWLLNRQMIQGMQVLHELEGRELAEYLGPATNLTRAEIAERIEHDADSDAEVFFLQVHGENGEVLFRSDNLADAVLPDLSHGSPHWTIELAGVGEVRVSEFHLDGWHIQVASRLAPSRRVLRDYAQVSGLLVLGVAGLSVALGWGFSHVTLEPIRAIERTAQRISGENLSERIEVPPGQDELAGLARLLNETFGRIETAFDQVKQFTADASHELKTPLALIRLNAEKLRPHLADDPEGDAALDDLLIEVERQHQIIESLLFLSKAESGVLMIERQPMRLPEWLESFAEDADVLAEDSGVVFKLEVIDPGVFLGVSNLLRQMLINLLSNALKVSPRGGVITLRAERAREGWRWLFQDEGPGLPEAQLRRVFDRFVRYDATSNSNRGPGHGLGLAICKGIVELHGGRIHAENRVDRRGLQIVIELPGKTTAG